MLFTGFINKPKSKMSFNQDINFHRVMSESKLRYSSPQRMLSCPTSANHRFKSVKSGSNLSLNSEGSKDGDRSSGDNSDHQGEVGLFVRGSSSLQSSFNSEHSSTMSVSTQGCSEPPSPPIAASLDPLEFSAAHFAPSFDPDNNNHIELTDLSRKSKKSHHSHHKKKKTKKSSKSSSASNVSTSPSTGSSNASTTDSGSVLTVIHAGSNEPTNQSSSSSGAWYQFIMPSYKGRLSTFHTLFMDIPTTEKLVDDFMCALHRDILLQGRLYLSVNYIAFYSNILGYETKVTINFRDVKNISKATTIKLFHNAIEVFTHSGERYFLTSFVSRDRAYREMKQLWSNAKGGDADKIVWSDVCKLIRQSYSTHNLGANLSDLEDADLEKHLSKHKTVRKRLQKKKDHLAANSNSSSEGLNGSKSSDEQVIDEEEIFEDSIDDLHVVPEDEVDGRVPLRKSKFDRLMTPVRLARISLGTVASAVLGRCHSNLSNQVTLIRLCCLLAFLLLLLQVALFFWITSFDDRLERYQQLMVQAVERQQQLQQLAASSSVSSVVVPSRTSTCNNQLPLLGTYVHQSSQFNS